KNIQASKKFRKNSKQISELGKNLEKYPEKFLSYKKMHVLAGSIVHRFHHTAKKNISQTFSNIRIHQDFYKKTQEKKVERFQNSKTPRIYPREKKIPSFFVFF